MRQTNVTMKDRFEGWSAWSKKQWEEQDVLGSKLEEAQVRIEALTLQNQEMSSRLEEAGRVVSALGGLQMID